MTNENQHGEEKVHYNKGGIVITSAFIKTKKGTFPIDAVRSIEEKRVISDLFDAILSVFILSALFGASVIDFETVGFWDILLIIGCLIWFVYGLYFYVIHRNLVARTDKKRIMIAKEQTMVTIEEIREALEKAMFESSKIS